jgi:hypothetical protein
LPVDFFKEKYDIKPDDDADIHRLRFSYKSDYFSFTEQYDMKSGANQLKSGVGSLRSLKSSSKRMRDIYLISGVIGI